MVPKPEKRPGAILKASELAIEKTIGAEVLLMVAVEPPVIKLRGELLCKVS